MMPAGKYFDAIESRLDDYFGICLTNDGFDKFYRLAKEFTSEEVLAALDIALEQYDDPDTVLTKIGGILYNRRNARKLYKDKYKRKDSHE